ncbi:hypothetical protein JCM19237_737 [Photobacterium aphoticum]|uniref:Uncharacterized protein n=1 Tax=Photobacterium aphoticum TaxID=754436 RepID=A0A090RN64_9GAMM|nr:hypothetical protein JCM19237_737 [Photobacterium aphoticum]
MRINQLQFFDRTLRRFTPLEHIDVTPLPLSEQQTSDMSNVTLDGGYLIPALTDIHTHSDFYFDSDTANQFAKNMGVAAQVGGLCGFHAVFDETQVTREAFEEYAAFLGTTGSIFTSFDALFAAAENADRVHAQLLGLNAICFRIR